jgi:hypothetical protein
MNFVLKGAGGEIYSPDRSSPPTFTVSKGDQKIFSGIFEYG